MIEIGTPTEEHRDQVADVLRVSLNLPADHHPERAARLPLDKMRCAFEGDRVVATAGARDFRQWFGGRELAMSGIWGVATLPEHRQEGLATRLVAELAREARAKGRPISALFPATLRPYRRLGYELAGTMTRHEVALDDLPSAPARSLEVREVDLERDLVGIRVCYRAAVSMHPGPIDCDEPDWWTHRILGPGFTDDVHRAVLARTEDGAVEGYASFTQPYVEGDLDVAFTIDCRHMVASTVEGLGSLLAYLRGFRGLGQQLRFTGPPAHPVTLLVEEQRVRPVWTFRWMLRLLDVPAALEQRGYPPVSGEAVITVHDERFPENRGPWQVVADEGTVKVARAEAGAGPDLRPIPIGTLSSMYTGFLSPFDAAALGLIDTEAVPFLARLFAGPAPWMHDFF
jgi:predicted acetyltransferase